MGAPQIIMTCLLGISVTGNLSLYLAGRTKNAKKVVATIIALALEVGLLMWGGFYG